MGFAICRFNKDGGCISTGSQEWNIYFPDLNKRINVPSMWRHYMLEHLILPNREEREIIMNANSSSASGEHNTTRSSAIRPADLMVLYVERLGFNKYTHNIGTEVDIEFIQKLELILENIDPIQTKMYDPKSAYR